MFLSSSLEFARKMIKEATTTHTWNYTLPNLFEYLDSLLALQEARNKSDSEIIRNLNSSFFIFGNFSDATGASLEEQYLLTSTSPQPANKPVFTLNLSIRSTMTSFLNELPQKLNSSDVHLMNGLHREPYHSSSYDKVDMDNPTSTNIFLDGNETFVSLDNSFWLASNNSNNLTSNGTTKTDNEALRELVSMVVTSTVLGIMILTTVIGNVFVIAAILLERNLQQVANFLIVSLAVADLMVACLVMPLGAVYEISNEWVLGPELCDMWTSSDVLCCTASILHLVAIALDRYWAVTRVDYIHSRNGKRLGTMIFFVWMTSFIVSIAPHFGWKDPDFSFRVTEQKKCLISQDLTYQIFATLSTFYVPLTAILILYWKIFQAARKRIHKKPGRNEIAQQMLKKVKPSRKRSKSNGMLQRRKDSPSSKREKEIITTAFTSDVSKNVGMSSEASSNNGTPTICIEPSPEICKPQASSPKDVHTISQHTLNSVSTSTLNKKAKKESLEAKREKKAAKTLAIITGAFVVCWLPFFVTVLTMVICPNCWMSDLMFSIFLWLGYFNSTLNPIIYTIFSPEFRQAFKRILCGKKHQRYRPGKIH